MSTTDELLRIVAEHPAGITAVEVAAILGRKTNSISNRMSRMYAYGLLDREMLRAPARPQGGARNCALYKSKRGPNAS